MSDGYARHTPTLSGTRIIRALSIDSALISDVSEAITQLDQSSHWVEVGDPISDITNECSRAVELWYSDMLIGSVQAFMGELPEGWIELDGSTYDEVDYPELYSYLDTVFKNEIAETFTLPNLDDSFIAGIDSTLVMGDTGGSSSIALSVAELPAHNHSYVPPVLNIDLEGPGVPDILAAGVGTPTTTGDTGSGNAHENRPKFIAMRYGIFAGRP